MTEIINYQLVSEIHHSLISNLIANQLSSGEFQTIAITGKNEKFYIGQSPFVTAHIASLLFEIKDARVKNIIEKAIVFLEDIDYTGKRIYKYWYKNAFGTAFPSLPFDLDDTSVVNQVLSLYNRNTSAVDVILNNRNDEGLFYTWLKPNLKTIIQNPSLICIYMEYIKTYTVFLKNKDGLVMADYNDSEIIVRLNVYIMLALMNVSGHIADDYFPFSYDEVSRELSSSLHYNNAAMYYLTLSKFQKHTLIFNNTDMERLSDCIRAYLKVVDPKVNFPDIISLYLSLAFIGKLNGKDVNEFLEQTKHVNFNKLNGFKVCVGNKRFKYFHEYCSVDFTIAMLIRLTYIIGNIS